MKAYYIESSLGWFVTLTKNKKIAKSLGVQEFGRGRVNEVRPATNAEVSYYEALKGKLVESYPY